MKLKMKNSLLKPLILFILISLISVYFLVPGFFKEIILPNNGDNNIAIGIMMHNMKALSHLSFSEVYHFPIYFPYSFTLTAGVNFIGQSIVLIPFYLMGIKNIYFLYNLLLIISLVCGGIAVYFFIREFVDNEMLSLAGGAVYILLPLRQINFPHPHLLFFFFSIYAFLFLMRYVKTFKRKDAFLFYLFLFLQALFSITLFFLTSIISVVLFVIFIIIKKKITFKVLLELTVGLILLGFFIFLIFAPYITNPLDISYKKAAFTSRTLLRSWDFYSTWFPLTFKFLRGHSTPLFLGFAASFFIFYFFYSKTKNILEKALSFLLLVFLTAPVFLTFYRGIPLRKTRGFVDILFLFMLLAFIVNTVLVWKKMALKEKFVLSSIVFMFLSCFRSLFEYIPLKTNFFYLVSLVVTRLTRLRGFKFKYYFIVFWIVLIFLGLQAFIKARKKSGVGTFLVLFLGFFVLFENFPPPLETGRIREYNSAEKKLYRQLEKYPDYYGVLELPHFRGFGDNKIFSLYTIYHNKHIYNGFYGVGVFDPLKIYKNQYFYPVKNIPEDINDKEIISYLRDKGIRIVVFHRSLLIFGKINWKERAKLIKEANKMWVVIVDGFRKAKNDGLLSEVDVLNNGIIAVISEQKKAAKFDYCFTYQYMKSKKFISLHLKKISEKPVDLSLELNGGLLLEGKLVEPYQTFKIEIPRGIKLNARGNNIEIKTSDEVFLQKIELLK
jgi:hypothetical protein